MHVKDIIHMEHQMYALPAPDYCGLKSSGVGCCSSNLKKKIMDVSIIFYGHWKKLPTPELYGQLANLLESTGPLKLELYSYGWYI